MTNCTCPSGDGSLRWPCPAHPPQLAPIDQILQALDLARGQIDGAEIAPAFYNFDYLTRVMQMVRELKQPADVSTASTAALDALRALELACDDLAAARTRDGYLVEIAGGRGDYLIAVDDARREARRVLYAAQAQPEGVTLGGCLETLFRLGEYLGVDYAASRKAPGAPSGVYIKAIEEKELKARDAALEEAAVAMEQTSRQGGALVIRALKSGSEAQQPVSGADGLPVPLTEIERKAITGLIELAAKAYNVAEDSEDDGSESNRVDKSSMLVLNNALDALEELPDDQPGYTMGPSNKAEWALRRLLTTEPKLSGNPGQLDHLPDATKMIEPSGYSGELAREFANRLNQTLKSLSPKYFNGFNVRTAIQDTVDSFTRIGHDELAKLTKSSSQQDADKVDAERWRTFINNYDEYGTVGFIDGSALKTVIDAARKEQA
ncbi:hypothetical protein [Alcaligenes aquatilis]|uniref:Uncharacterized protein n=1 Tax=Alcaligenes aquatilis TaxID=323284 RepID=A0A3G2HWS9_9BURK|nr:hypothetical protein [Alcaligenes aquatilis]AYN21626.1 hypothetical protein D3M96_14450 [Alcaligenes aquatilis]